MEVASSQRLRNDGEQNAMWQLRDRKQSCDHRRSYSVQKHGLVARQEAKGNKEACDCFQLSCNAHLHEASRIVASNLVVKSLDLLSEMRLARKN